MVREEETEPDPATEAVTVNYLPPHPEPYLKNHPQVVLMKATASSQSLIPGQIQVLQTLDPFLSGGSRRQFGTQ